MIKIMNYVYVFLERAWGDVSQNTTIGNVFGLRRD